MNEINKCSKRKIYIQPSISRVVIDNDISLALESLSDPGDEPLTEIKYKFNQNDPYKTTLL